MTTPFHSGDEPLSDREKSQLKRMFSDFMEVPGEWKSELASWLESNPPVLGRSVLGQRIALGQLPGVEAPRSVAGGVGFQNSWVDFAGGVATAAYWKDPWGIVHLRGTIKNGAIGGPAFTLPVGYRQSAGLLIYPAMSNAAIGRLDINTNGDVIPSIGSNVYFCLDGITFKTG